MVYTIGVDVGNFDTKSKNTNTVSGYATYKTEQLLADKVLHFKDKYYIESIDNRFPYVEDKTNNDQCLILTLFAISKEIMYRIKESKHLVGNIQDEISQVTCVNLAIGLPPGHFNKLALSTVNYYKENLKNGVTYTYAGYKFSYKVNIVEIYAQDLTAVIMDKSLAVNKWDDESDCFEIPKYYIIGIGGYTVDIIPIKEGSPAVDECRSLPLGTRPMFESIITHIQSSYGITLDEKTVENIIKGKKAFVSDDVKTEICEYASKHANLIIDKCIQAGCLLNQYPVVYVGGGGLLLRNSLETNSNVCMSEFITDTHANASNYEKFLKMKYKLDS